MKNRGKPPKVTVEKCASCGLCISVCPSFVLDWVDEKATVRRPEWCIGCGHCGAVCPTEAVFSEATSFERQPQPGPGPATSPETLQLLLRERRSIRSYTSDPVPKELIQSILEAARYGPTGSNSQNVHYLVMTSPDGIARLQRMTIGFYEKIFSRARGRLSGLLFALVAGRRTLEYLRGSLPKVEYAYAQMPKGRDILFYHAPVVILTHAESWDSSSPFNCSVALYQGSLMAHTLGLGCCFNGFLVNAVNHDRKISDWLKIPAGHKCYSAMTLGYPKVRYRRLIARDPAKVTWR